jgi:methylenetetrahydrofolate dehydrogenase (NADP+) / methenyltetrahydrofolate cyclohydrolase
MSLLDGKKISKLLDETYIKKIELLKKNNIIPCLAVILANNKKESLTYISMKKKKCDKLGIAILILKMDETIEDSDILYQIQNFNNDKNIHGILVQLPLPNHINKFKILSSINPSKDVDGFHYSNIGKLALDMNPLFKPCTPEGCIYLLDYYNIDLKGKNIVVIGKSHIVGLPLALLLLNRDATVTICHIYTDNIKQKTLEADIICVGCGVPYLVKEDWIKKNTVIIDIGINKIEDPTSKNGFKLVGDVDFENCKSKCSYITPVPGGVGPMTVSILIKNVIDSCYNLNSSYIA